MGYYILVVAHTKNPRSNTDVNERFYILRGTQMYVLTSIAAAIASSFKLLRKSAFENEIDGYTKV